MIVRVPSGRALPTRPGRPRCHARAPDWTSVHVRETDDGETPVAFEFASPNGRTWEVRTSGGVFYERRGTVDAGGTWEPEAPEGDVAPRPWSFPAHREGAADGDDRERQAAREASGFLALDGRMWVPCGEPTYVLIASPRGVQARVVHSLPAYATPLDLIRLDEVGDAAAIRPDLPCDGRTFSAVKVGILMPAAVSGRTTRRAVRHVLDQVVAFVDDRLSAGGRPGLLAANASLERVEVAFGAPGSATCGEAVRAMEGVLAAMERGLDGKRHDPVALRARLAGVAARKADDGGDWEADLLADL